MLLPSLLVSVHAAAIRAVDGGGGGEALHPAGERGGVSTGAGLIVLRTFIHGGGCRCASGANLGLGLHTGGPCTACQQVSLTLWAVGEEKTDPSDRAQEHIYGIQI